jgi:hypothetical protein
MNCAVLGELWAYCPVAYYGQAAPITTIAARLSSAGSHFGYDARYISHTPDDWYLLPEVNHPVRIS